MQILDEESESVLSYNVGVYEPDEREERKYFIHIQEIKVTKASRFYGEIITFEIQRDKVGLMRWKIEKIMVHIFNFIPNIF